ncbi:galectin-9 isoform X1 [Harpegnathos saltator]|uniref:Galectin n=1 Tax=Harpegnathos saltator TaxID=610380 RepID=E2BPR0_HARSA|nr:galectin-9 isoform X1 [Harpegnathos saltator]EFN82261.1 Galectin-4 [Harpegnathos saltator]
MSSSSNDILTLAREEAFKDFSYFDEETVPVDTCKPIPLHPLKPTSAVIITGYIPENASRFSVNLTCKTPGNIALHFNPRLDRGYIVRNTKVRGSWDDEETCSPASPSGCIFRRNAYAHITIFCTNNAFQIGVNGEHFCAFSYRMPLEEITALEVNGTIEDVRTRQLNIFVYPDPSICRPCRTLVLTAEEPLVDFLDVPITVDIGSEFRVGARLFITGRLKLLPHSFYVNLQKGKTIYPHPVIPLHLNPRFLYGNTAPCVIMNCWINGAWGHEERHQGHLSWMPGRDFLLTIRCEYEGYTIWLGNKMIGEFKHRLQSSITDTLRISGDVVLYQLSMSYA